MVESVKAVSEIFCPVSGKIVGRNEAVVEDPSLINKSYYDKGRWRAPNLINSLALGGCDSNFKSVISEYVLWMKVHEHISRNCSQVNAADGLVLSGSKHYLS